MKLVLQYFRKRENACLLSIISACKRVSACNAINTPVFLTYAICFMGSFQSKELSVLLLGLHYKEVHYCDALK